MKVKTLEQLGISPAPWSLLDDGTIVVAEVDAEDCVYGEVAVCDGGKADDANARLIASAPELYDALRVLVGINEHGAREDMLIPAAWEYARIALRKAGGEAAASEICADCAERAGLVLKDKAVGWWEGKCGVCGETKPVCDRGHDYAKREGGEA